MRFVPAGVEVDCDVSVGRLRYVGVELHGQAGGGVAEPGLDDPGVRSLLDHETGCDVPQPLTEVVLSADGTTLLLNSGEACTITMARFVDPTPCATEAHGLCDVAMEPSG